MKTTDTREYKQSLAISSSLKKREGSSKKSGAMFLCGVLKRMCAVVHPEYFKRGSRK